MVKTSTEYDLALAQLWLMEPMITTTVVHPAIRGHYREARRLLVDGQSRRWHGFDAQAVRNELLDVRQLMGQHYESLPAPDKLIRHCDAALGAIPGEGEPSQVPYE